MFFSSIFQELSEVPQISSTPFSLGEVCWGNPLLIVIAIAYSTSWTYREAAWIQMQMVALLQVAALSAS